MGASNVVFMEVLEWFDQSGQEMVQRIPESGSGERSNGELSSPPEKARWGFSFITAGQSMSSVRAIEDYLGKVIVSRLNDYMWENLESFLQ